MPASNYPRKLLFTAFAVLVTFLTCGIIDVVFAHYHVLRKATYIYNFLLAGLAGAFVFALETYHERETRRLHELADLVEQMNHHIRNALQVITYANLSHNDASAAQGVRDSISRIEWVLRDVLCESAIRMGVRAVPQGMGTTGPQDRQDRQQGTLDFYFQQTLIGGPRSRATGWRLWRR